ncbi:hypothetical protein URH17368_1255 [Alicyclobacillus hesperidum URH17-3-68]|uniref:Uncharacterized protein n=1 Tax=Alicyclobacillus hesperidum TaxID=89784 RepID=A0A1H2XLL8_9BACL|nr:hypothetical protein URH17368_1255 [Alicyclobacillus hesperidum URH17-3-68]GLG02345.1 hypothetical protein Alches_23860 [Alicyclobacillus hesperidum subsp. aegles]GLV14439.1 hypothetical protein Heshes_21230 [Alicyclobacillus hesperidum]SDW93636.1 hypothetical protein SAMN04489725_12222 [Alicyclobacillus hesperidum]
MGKQPKPVHNDANKTLPIEEHVERVQGEKQRSQSGKGKK